MKQTSNNKLVLVTLFFVIIIDAMGSGLVFPILAPLLNAKVGGILPIATSIDVRDFYYSLTIAAFPVCMFFGAPILGDLSDHIGRKKVLLICLYGVSFGMLLSALSIQLNSLFLLVFARGFTGLLAGSFAVAQASIVDISSSKNKAINISMIALANVSGFVLGPLLGGILVDPSVSIWFGFYTPFLAACVLALFNATLLIFTYKETFITKTRKKIQFGKGLIMFISAFINQRIRKLAIAFFCMNLGWMLFIIFVPLYLVQIFNESPIYIGQYTAWIAGLMGFALLVIMRVLLKFFKPSSIFRFSLFSALCGTLIILIKSKLALWLGVIPIAFGIGMGYSSCITMFSDAVDSKSQGWIMGLAGAVGAASNSFGSLSIGFLAATFITLPIIISALMFIIAIVIQYLTLPPATP